MFKVNEDYLKLPGSYLFSTIAQKKWRHTRRQTRIKVSFVWESGM